MKCRMLVLLLAGSALFQLGCGGGGGGGIPTCSGTFKACGGDLTGKWSIDGLCMEGDIKSVFAVETADMPKECSDLFQSVSVEMSGTIEFANGNQISDVATKMDMKFKYTAACLSAMGGSSVTLTKEMCDSIESSANSDPSDEDDMTRTVSCSFSKSCNCTMTMSGQSKETVGYTVSGNTLTTEDGDTAEYCISGKNLTVRDLSGGDVAGQTKLHRI